MTTDIREATRAGMTGRSRVQAPVPDIQAQINTLAAQVANLNIEILNPMPAPPEPTPSRLLLVAPWVPLVLSVLLIVVNDALPIIRAQPVAGWTTIVLAVLTITSSAIPGVIAYLGQQAAAVRAQALYLAHLGAK